MQKGEKRNEANIQSKNKEKRPRSIKKKTEGRERENKPTAYQIHVNPNIMHDTIFFYYLLLLLLI
jgi:hypothetical protein